MNIAEMNRMRKAAFSPLTIFKSQRQEMLADAIRNNPALFIEYLTQYKLRPQPQLELMSFFLDLAIVNGHLVEDYRTHLEMFLINNTYTWLWPSSVALLGTSLSRFKTNLTPQTASYY